MSDPNYRITVEFKNKHGEWRVTEQDTIFHVEPLDDIAVETISELVGTSLLKYGRLTVPKIGWGEGLEVVRRATKGKGKVCANTN